MKIRVSMTEEGGKRLGRRDVARLAGVSMTAVTHALNGTPGIRMSKGTKEKIKHVAESIGYRPSFMGRALVSGKNYTVGLMQPSSASFVNFFHQELCRELAETLQCDDYNMLLLFRSDDFKYMRPIEQGRMDAMIVMQSDTDMLHAGKVISSGIPTAILNVEYPLNEGAKAFCVHSDYIAFTGTLLAQFLSSGGKKMLAIIDSENSYTNWRICKEIISRSGDLLRKGASVTTIRPDWGDFRGQARNLLRLGFDWDSLFVNSYAQAKIVIEEMNSAGLVNGRDFKIWAGDFKRNPSLPENPTCTTFLQDIKGLAASSWEGLKRIMDGCEQEKNISIPYLKIEGTEIRQYTEKNT